MNSLAAFNTYHEPFYESYGELVPWSDFPVNDWPDGPYRRAWFPYASFQDREDGNNRPYYENETDLAFQVASVRRFVGCTELPEAVTTALKVYTYGNGIEVKCQPSKQGAKYQSPEIDTLCQNIQRVIDRFCDYNNLINNLDHEIDRRSRDEGECLLPIIPKPGQNFSCNPIETVQLSEPTGSSSLSEWVMHKHGIDCDSFVPSWKYGVLTEKRDTSCPLAYFVKYGSAESDWETYGVDQFVHIKRNVYRACKRGMSDWLACYENATQQPKLRSALGYGATMQARIAWIEEYGTDKMTVSGSQMRDGSPSNDGTTRNGRNGTRDANSTDVKNGTILRVKYGKQYKSGPMGSERNANFLLVEEALERLLGARWLMPKYMISGDPGDASFASSLMSESPFVKAREADQQFYGGSLKSMMWKVVQYAWKLGWLDLRGFSMEQVKSFIDILVNFPSVATRDKLQLAQQLTAEKAMGTISDRTIAADMGRDYDEEMASKTDEGTGQPDPNAPPVGPGVLSQLGARQINNTRSAQLKILNDYRDKKISRVMAKGQLLAASVDDATAEAYLKDVDDNGQIDNPALAGAVQGALESVLESAREEMTQILGEYP